MQFSLLNTDAVLLCFWWTQKWWLAIYGNMIASICKFHILLTSSKAAGLASDTRIFGKFV